MLHFIPFIFISRSYCFAQYDRPSASVCLSVYLLPSVWWLNDAPYTAKVSEQANRIMKYTLIGTLYNF